MRTKLSVAAALAAGTLAVQAQVYSVNIVGYVNTSLVASNKYTLVNNPLNVTASGGNAYSNLFATLPAGSQVIRWNSTVFSSANKTATGFLPTSAGGLLVNPGQGVFLRTPAASSGFTNTFVGEVVTGSSTNVLPTGYALVGSITPLAGTVNSLGLTNAIPASPSGSQLLKWNPTTQVYQTFNRAATAAGWLPSIPSVAVGEGFFVRNNSGSSQNWIQTLNP